MNIFKDRRSVAREKPADEKKIENDAHAAIRESRKQLGRASTILEGEIRRLDRVLEGNK